MTSDATVSGVTSNPGTPQVRRSGFEDLSVGQLYALLRLRVDVFVVEQQCAYPELDGQDARPDTTHYWVELDSLPVATLRVLQGSDAIRIGRVATSTNHRRHGHAALLMRAALFDLGDIDICLEAQRHLQDWYARFGFARVGADYVEDGIAHVPMMRRAGAAQ